MRVDRGRALSPSDFSAFFWDVHGYQPFPWQQRLTAQVLDRGEWPAVIDLPTGTGKTAVLDTAVFAMALRPDIFPRRVVFVIDRRIVVDQVCERATRIRDRVKVGATPLLSRLRDRLRGLSGGEQEPLGVAALRGGIPVDNEWAQQPDQPWVVVSTVDQLGSRLLFRGYGVSPGMRPVHAGLAGNDCLVIMDEVHLSSAFAETLANVAGPQSGLLNRRFAIVEMSATPTNMAADRFTLDTATDLEGCEELRRRVGSPKRAELLATANQDSIPALALKQIKAIERSRAPIRSIGVVVNRVRTARETSKLLVAGGYSTYLLTGRMRPLDRVEVLQEVDPIVDPERVLADDGIAVVVATQSIEVGADFSFDAMLVECAPVDSLRQRFGRLDRRGTYSDREGGPARAWIICPKSVVTSKRSDPIYGDAVKLTWQELQRLGKSGSLDVSPMSLGGFPEGAEAPRAAAPLLLSTHMDAWAQTRPEPLVEPPLDWFLHGIDETRPADVSVLWRWDRTAEALRLVPPRQAEFLSVPVAAAKAWLSDCAEVDVADVPGEHPEGTESVGADEGPSGFVRWLGFGDEPEAVPINEIRPGDVLVVDPTRGGLRSGTWDPSGKDCVQDLGDAAQIAYGRRATLRLDGRLFPQDQRPPKPAETVDSDTPRDQLIRDWLARRASDPVSPQWLRQVLGRLEDGRFAVNVVGGVGDFNEAAYYVLTEQHKSAKPVVDVALLDGADEASSLTGTGVRLAAHLEGVGERAAKTAERLGFPSEVVDDIRLAGRLHDLGKVDRRFQMQLMGWDPVEFEMRRDEPLAKSLRNVDGAPPREFGQDGLRYPRGMRHEVASVALIESNTEVLAEAHDKDLVVHLVSTHHGWCRPLPPIVEDPEPQTLRYEIDDLPMETTSDLSGTSMAVEMAERFWRLTERYGHHGLAWLEAVLRLADHQQSADEAKRS